MKGNLIVLSGPSGSGKTTMVREVMKKFPNSYFSISTTTRSPRENEINGKDYFFVSKDEFLEDIKKGYFLEWAEVHGNFYGTSLKPILENLEKGNFVFLDIDVQGYEIISQKDEFKNCLTSVFITTKNMNILKQRLKNRGTDDDETINLRLLNALNEMKKIDLYEYFIVNDVLEESVLALESIVRSTLYKNKKDFEFISKWKGE